MYVPYFLIQFSQKLFFFEFENCRKFKQLPLFSISYPINCIFAEETIQERKLFKGGNYLRKYGMSMVRFLGDAVCTSGWNSDQSTSTFFENFTSISFLRHILGILVKYKYIFGHLLSMVRKIEFFKDMSRILIRKISCPQLKSLDTLIGKADGFTFSVKLRLHSQIES